MARSADLRTWLESLRNPLCKYEIKEVSDAEVVALAEYKIDSESATLEATVTVLKNPAYVVSVRATYMYVEKESKSIIRLFARQKEENQWLKPELAIMENLADRAVKTNTLMKNALTLRPKDTTTMYLRILLRVLYRNPLGFLTLTLRDEIEKASDAEVVALAEYKIDCESATLNITSNAFSQAFNDRAMTKAKRAGGRKA